LPFAAGQNGSNHFQLFRSLISTLTIQKSLTILKKKQFFSSKLRFGFYVVTGVFMRFLKNTRLVRVIKSTRTLDGYINAKLFYTLTLHLYRDRGAVSLILITRFFSVYFFEFILASKTSDF